MFPIFFFIKRHWKAFPSCFMEKRWKTFHFSCVFFPKKYWQPKHVDRSFFFDGFFNLPENFTEKVWKAPFLTRMFVQKCVLYTLTRPTILFIDLLMCEQYIAKFTEWRPFVKYIDLPYSILTYSTSFWPIVHYTQTYVPSRAPYALTTWSITKYFFPHLLAK